MFNKNKKIKQNEKNNTSLTSSTASLPSEYVEKPTVIRIMGEIDKPFLILVLLLVGIGVIAVASASYSYAEATQGNSSHFTVRHLFWVCVGLVLMCIGIRVDYRIYKNLSIVIFIVSLLLCAAVLTPLGHTTNGATRWIKIGPLTFQPSEVLKFAVVIICARYASDAKEKIRQLKSIWAYAAIFGCCVFLLVLQKHLSCLIIITAIIACMMIISGVNGWFIFGCGLLAGGAGVSLLAFFPHAFKRLAVWYDPFDPIYFKNDGWQPAQSLFAIASGGMFGVGLGQSNQKDGYIPEPQNDYIFSVICEELGFVGAVAIMAVFAALIWRGFYISKKASTKFSGLLVAGIMCQIGIQTLLNIAVVTNTLPSTGISLPFLSYGGNSIMVLLFEAGVVLGVSKHTVIEQE